MLTLVKLIAPAAARWLSTATNADIQFLRVRKLHILVVVIIIIIVVVVSITTSRYY